MKRSIRITKNTLALIMREGLNKGALFILLVCIARILGKEALGRYSLAIIISQIFFFGTELGLNVLVIREVAKNRSLAKKFILSVGIVRLLLGILTMALIWFTALVIGARGEAATVIYLCGICYFIVSVVNLHLSIFRALEKMELELFVIFIKNIIFLPAALSVLLNGGGLIAVFQIFLVANIVALLISMTLCFRHVGVPGWGFDFDFIKQQLSYALPLWLGQLFAIAYLKIAPLLLFRLKGEEAVGLYNAGFIVVDGFWVLMGCFGSSLFPIMSRLNVLSPGQTKTAYLNGFRFTLLIFLPLGVIFMISAPGLVEFIYGGKFIEIVPLFRLLTVAALLVAVDVLNGFTIIAIGKQIFIPFMTGAGLLVNLTANALFIERFSYMGSACALVISESLVLVLALAVLQRFLLVHKSEAS